MRRLPGLLFWPLAVGTVVAFACVLAAPVHRLLVDAGWMDPGDRDFLRVLRRLLLLPLVLVFLLRVRPWRGARPGAYGLRGPRARARPALLGFALTVLVLVGVLAWQGAMGWLRLEDPLRPGELARRLGTYLVGGVVVGVLEEWFFRGWLVERGTRDVGPRFGVFVSALLFALVHAFRPSRLTVAVAHDAAGAFEALRGWLAHAVDLQAFGPAAFGLFAFALLLTAAYRRTGTLWTAVGIHAGAVLVLYSYGALTDRAPERTWAGTRLLYDGPVVQALCLLGAACLWPWGRAPATGDDGEHPAPG